MIKFRAWDKVQNKMLLPDNIEFINGQAYWTESSTDGNGGYSNDGKVDGVDALFELEQFTGLKDVNDREIYENDVVQFPILGKPHREIVVWSAKDASFIVGMTYLSRFQSKMEVLGNVHQDGDLSEADYDTRTG